MHLRARLFRLIRLTPHACPANRDSIRRKISGIAMVNSLKRVNVLVLLGYGFGANTWDSKYPLGLIPGLNDRLAYGYHRAAGQGWSIEYSLDHDEHRLTRLGRVMLRRLLGFDLIHIVRNRRRMMRADIVW